MTAILKLDLDAVRSLCEAVGEGVCIANHNAPTQIVVSGDPVALETLASRAGKLGGRAIALPVSGPFHSRQMLPAQEALEPILRELSFATPAFPVVSGVTGTAETEPSRLQELLCRQMTSPVRWVDVVHCLEAEGVTRAVEIGSGDVLTRLGRQTSSAIRFMTYEEAIDEGI
jgi:[acyl-carrier-protein] S-malonyltransferase